MRARKDFIDKLLGKTLDLKLVAAIVPTISSNSTTFRAVIELTGQIHLQKGQINLLRFIIHLLINLFLTGQRHLSG